MKKDTVKNNSNNDTKIEPDMRGGERTRVPATIAGHISLILHYCPARFLLPLHHVVSLPVKEKPGGCLAAGSPPLIFFPLLISTKTLLLLIRI
jgi:hypothetical protein